MRNLLEIGYKKMITFKSPILLIDNAPNYPSKCIEIDKANEFFVGN